MNDWLIEKKTGVDHITAFSCSAVERCCIPSTQIRLLLRLSVTIVYRKNKEELNKKSSVCYVTLFRLSAAARRFID